MTCPACAEEVNPNAKVCKHCGRNLTHRWYDPLGTNKALIIASLIATTFVLWGVGALDRPLSEIGLNRGTCAENLFGKTMCGGELVQFCKEHYGAGNRDTCDGVLADEGIDPGSVAAERRRREREFEACVMASESVANCDVP